MPNNDVNDILYSPDDNDYDDGHYPNYKRQYCDTYQWCILGIYYYHYLCHCAYSNIVLFIPSDY